MPSEDLITFRRRFEEWEHSHPRYWIVTTEQINRIVSAQFEAADRIIVSQDRIADEVSRISSQGIGEILCTLDWGFSEMVWQLELQTETLRGILKVLQKPLDTQAKELRRRAEEAYRNGWIDDALEDLLESEKKNRYDFTVHQSLGNIYLFHKKNPEKALEYYEKATRYAEPYSSYNAARALLHIGLIRYLQGNFQKAYEATSEALKLSPYFYEAHYQHAQYCAIIGKYNEAIDHLEKAIVGNRYYCVKVDLEKDFDVMRERVRSFLKKWRDESRNWAKTHMEKAQELVQYAESYGVSDVGSSDESNKLKVSKKKLDEARALLEEGSLFDCWDAAYKALVSQRLAAESSVEFLSNQISLIHENIRKRREKHAENGMVDFLLVIGFLVSLLLSPFIGMFIYRIIRSIEYAALGGVVTFFACWIGPVLIADLIEDKRFDSYCNKYRKKLAPFEKSLSDAKIRLDELGIEKKADRPPRTAL